MDFSKFDSRTGAETAGRLHLVDPGTGVPLYADEKNEKPCIVLVLGTESATAQNALREKRKARITGAKADAGDSIEALHAAMVEGAKPLIVGFENVARGKEAATIADAEWFLNLQMLNGRDDEKSFVEQVLDFASSRRNFLGNASLA